MRKYIAKYFGFPIQDYTKKTDIINTLRFLRESQFWDEQKIKDYQLEKLKSLVEFSYRNVPYYEKTFRKINLKPSDIRKLSDIVKIPILTKEVVRKENLNLLARGVNITGVTKGKTGGTTGPPIILYKDSKSKSFSLGSYYRWHEWMGLNYYDKVATFWGLSSVTNYSYKKKYSELIINYIQNNIRINSFNLTSENLLKAYEKINSFNPLLLKGYLSALLDFGEFIEKNNLSPIKPKAISTTTETLLPHHRNYLKKVFNAPVYDQYGCGELSAISYECKMHNGLHVNTEHILLEILNSNDDIVIDEIGRVVGTDLDNYIMPFIRYENGDLSSIDSNECSCGVNQPLMKSIEGRTIDTICLKNGQNVHGVFFTSLLNDLNILSSEINKFQVYQNIHGEIDFRVQVDNPLDKNKKETLINSLSKYFKNVSYSEHKRLKTEDNGKFRYIINDK